MGHATSHSNKNRSRCKRSLPILVLLPSPFSPHPTVLTVRHTHTHTDRVSARDQLPSPAQGSQAFKFLGMGFCCLLFTTRQHDAGRQADAEHCVFLVALSRPTLSSIHAPGPLERDGETYHSRGTVSSREEGPAIVKRSIFSPNNSQPRTRSCSALRLRLAITHTKR